MTTDFYIQLLVLVSVFITGGLIIWVCRILRFDFKLSHPEMTTFASILILYLLLVACAFTFFAYSYKP
jgi:hypothetical protein